jgi:6-phosphogluconolactonase
MSFEVVVRPSADLATLFASHLAEAVERASMQGRTCSLVIPGGSVGETFFPALVHAPVAWRAVEVFWSDERAVPADHPDSNYRLARALLLDHVPVDEARVHPMFSDAMALDVAAAEYERKLVARLGRPPRVDVALLGVGEDGHVCSLFPGHPALEETTSLVAAVTDAPKPPPRRLTLTLPALAGTSLVCIGAFGAAKAAVIGEAVEHPASALPVARVVRGAGRALFLLDGEAGRALKGARGLTGV